MTTAKAVTKSMDTRKKVLVAMSGGVDSSAAVKLLMGQGYSVSGATMRLDVCDDSENSNDAEDARRVAENLGIEFFTFDLREEFKRFVVDRFVKTYTEGKTPNPCVYCNKALKFGLFLEKAKELGFDFIATGHYVLKELDEEKNIFRLKRSPDAKKDQSYVLYCLTQEQLSKTLFPCGELSKEQIRQLAQENGLVNADKPDSQDICFIPDGNYARFIEQTLGKTFPQGDFVLEDGKFMGKHNGHIRYTVGQRKGLGVSYTEPLFVIKKDTCENKIVLGTSDELFSDRLFAEEVSFISDEFKEKTFRADVSVRYHQQATPATVTILENGRAEVVFDQPKRAVSSGQAVVFYDGDYVLGGGIIE